MMKLNVNIEFNGEMADVMNELNALSSILSALNCTTSATALTADVSETDPKTLSPGLGAVEQHPKTDAAQKETSVPKKR